MAGIAVATTAVRSLKAESTAILRPFDDADVPEVGGVVLDVRSREQAAAAHKAATRRGDGRIPL